jgi:hypothetical protein
MEVGVFVAPILCGVKDENCSNIGAFDIVLYVHAFYWILYLLFDRYYSFFKPIGTIIRLTY